MTAASVDYDGPDESVECAYPGCTNRLRRAAFADEPQFCSREHRDRRSAASIGTALVPLVSIAEPCPGCAGALEADLSVPCLWRVAFAEASLAREQLEHWWSICRVTCSSCGWAGSARRPEEKIAA